MFKTLLAAALTIGVATASTTAIAQTVSAAGLPRAPENFSPDVQLVEEANFTAKAILNVHPTESVRKLLRKSRAVVIIPSHYKLAFVLGGSGGNGLMINRNVAGQWDAAHRMRLYEGSVGLQAGANVSETLLFVMTQEAVDAIKRGKFRLGAEAGLAVLSVGGDVAAGLSSRGHSIIAVSRSVGLFGGVSLEGAYLEYFDHGPLPLPATATLLNTLEAASQ